MSDYKKNKNLKKNILIKLRISENDFKKNSEIILEILYKALQVATKG